MSKVTKEQGEKLIQAFSTINDVVSELSANCGFLNAQSEEQLVQSFEDEEQGKTVCQLITALENMEPKIA